MEPENKNSPEWRYWFVRHNFGATTAARIISATKEELKVLEEYIKGILEAKK